MLLFATMRYTEGICIFEVNTRYISSNVLKISIISRVRSTSEIANIFNTWDEIFLVFAEKSKSSYFSVKGKNLTFFIVISR